MFKSVAYIGIFTALAVVLSYVEFLISIPIAMPGIKLGLANIVVLIALYNRGASEAFVLSVLRVAISALLFSGVAGGLYSLAGGLLSFAAMILAKRVGLFSIVGVSVLGGVFHNLGQLALAAMVLQNEKLLYYAPALIISGELCGLLTGLVAAHTLPFLPRKVAT